MFPLIKKLVLNLKCNDKFQSLVYKQNIRLYVYFDFAPGRARRARHSRGVENVRQRNEDDELVAQPGAPINLCIWTQRKLIKELEPNQAM